MQTQDSHSGNSDAAVDVLPAQKRIRFRAILVTGANGVPLQVMRDVL